jgi:hypothetical protein
MISYISSNTFIGSTNFPILQNQLEGGTKPMIYKHQPKGSYNSLYSLSPTKMRLLLRIQPEGISNSLSSMLPIGRGYDPIYFPHTSTLKYKCRPTITTTIFVSVTATITSTYNLSTCHYI